MSLTSMILQMTRVSLLACVWLSAAASAQVGAGAGQAESQRAEFLRSEFRRAWQAARAGNRDESRRIAAGLQDYVLYPYLQYDDYLARRRQVDPAELSAFLQQHEDWAFTDGLERSWLRDLGESGRWQALLSYGADSGDTEVACYHALAAVRTGQGDQVRDAARELWAVGQSQPDACDPLFDWLRRNREIDSELAWLRIRRAMQAGNPRLTLYVERYLDSGDAIWADRWQEQERGNYQRLDRAVAWPSQPKAIEIVVHGLLSLARKDADRAWHLYPALQSHFRLDDDSSGQILQQIALWSAVDGAPETPERMRAVPESARSDQLLEWWARHGLATGNWAEVILAVAAMTQESRDSDRWRYWDARARLEMGDPGYANELLQGLARQATYHGFLAADRLDQPYAICPSPAQLDAAELQAFEKRPAIQRALELAQVDLMNWSRSEWRLATRDLSAPELRSAAALAHQQGWHYQAIVALAGSNDLGLYEFRFPLAYVELVEPQAEARQLDISWVLGLMRSESAMAADAISPADARGLLQVTPGTAKQIARRHGYSYRGSSQLLQAEDNVLFGTTFMRELMDKYGDNPVLVSGAYNAGPGAVNRWLESLPGDEADIWIEVLPYYETRDYIPRVLAFSTIYDYRMQKPVRRISSRMPAPADSMAATQGKRPSGNAPRLAPVACPAPELAMQSHRQAVR